MIYKCKKCRHSFKEEHFTKVRLRDIRCPNCGSGRIKPKYRALERYVWLIVSLITGTIGAWLGIFICSDLGFQGAELTFGLVGFLVGFVLPSVYWVYDYIKY